MTALWRILEGVRARLDAHDRPVRERLRELERRGTRLDVDPPQLPLVHLQLLRRRRQRGLGLVVVHVQDVLGGAPQDRVRPGAVQRSGLHRHLADLLASLARVGEVRDAQAVAEAVQLQVIGEEALTDPQHVAVAAPAAP